MSKSLASDEEKEDRRHKIETWLHGSKDGDQQPKVGNWMIDLAPHILLSDTSPTSQNPLITFTYTVQPEHCNRMHSLHGGCVASIFDLTTTLAIALVSRPGFWESMGVSRTLSVTYLRPAPVGTELVVECEIVQIGRMVAALKGTMRRRSDGRVTATCEHTKVNVDARVKI